MARFLFSKIPSAGLQAILHHLDVQDWVALLQVSCAVSQQTAQHIPYIILLLTENSTAEQLQRWFQATRQFEEVSSVYVRIDGEVSADVFDLAMQLLSQRSKPVTELHLLANEQYDSDDSSSDCETLYVAKAHVPTLQPLQHVSPHLRTLVIEAISVQNMANDLEQLAAAARATGGWQQLQNLTLNADWSYPKYPDGSRMVRPCLWSDFWLGLANVSTAYPNLQDLTLGVPFTGCYCDEAEYYSNDESSTALLGEHCVIVFALDVFGDENFIMYYNDGDDQVQAAAAAVAMVAAVFHAALQLKQLRTLNVGKLPDIWDPQPPIVMDKRFEKELGTHEPSLLEIPVAVAAEGTAVAFKDASPKVHKVVQIATAAAGVLGSLDDGGKWLLQQNPSIRSMHIELTGSDADDWSMSREQ